MKDISKIKMIMLLILAITLIAGIVTLFTAKFEKTAEYKAGIRIEVYIPQGYDKQEIIDIAKECFVNKEVIFSEIDNLNQIAGIKINEEYTEDELNSFKDKISEKYEIEKEELEIYEISVPAIRISTDIKPYVLPITLTTIFSLIYVFLKNIKNVNKWKYILKIVLPLAIIIGIYFSLILIIRIPYGASTMPIALVIYIITLITVVNNIKK